MTHEVAATLRGRIAHGEFRPGMRLPSERALAARLNVSRVTVVRALTRLRLEGLVVTRHGSGTFVATTDRLLPSLDSVIQRRTRLLTENLRHLEHRLRAIGQARLRWHSPAGGITLWLDLHPRSSHEVVRACARLGVLLEPASTYAVDGRDDRHLRIPFTVPPPTLDRVADALTRVLGSRPT